MKHAKKIIIGVITLVVGTVIAHLVIRFVNKTEPPIVMTVSGSPSSINTVNQIGNNTIINNGPKTEIYSQRLILLNASSSQDSRYKQTVEVIVKHPKREGDVIHVLGNERFSGLSIEDIGTGTLVIPGDSFFSRTYKVTFFSSKKISETDYRLEIK